MVLLSIKPRLQKEKWSLYWKCSMATRTMYLDEFDLDVDIAKTTARELKKMIAERVGLPPVAELFRLEGFQEPWELIQYKGVELQADKPLSESGVPEKDESDMSGENGVPIIVAVRKHLVAEGWKMVHNDAMDSDTEEDDF
ncbi:unnamed protein product [Bathycoccus prasinos]